MKGRRRSRLAGAVLAGVAGSSVVALLVLAAMRSARGVALRYLPDSEVPRPAGEVVQLPGVLAVRDFDGDVHRMYLLDPLTPAVHVLEETAGGWRRAGSFGRRGGGPGEFATPTGVAVLHDGRVAVAEPGRLHFFTAAGDYLESTAPVLPCAVGLPQVAAASPGLFIHGSCLQAGGRTDTMQMVLYWSPDGTAIYPLASDPRYTTDGRLGTAYGADAGLSDGLDHELFGAGNRPCVYRITSTDSMPVAGRTCEDGQRPFRLELSERTRASLEERRRLSPLMADALRIPDRHPAYVERVVLAAGDAWLRSYSEDSLVLRLIGDERDVAVLPYRGLIGCRRLGCLWAVSSLDGASITLYRTTLLDSLARWLRPAGGFRAP